MNKKNRIAEVNAALKARGCDERLRRGRGYLYFTEGNSTAWPSSSVYVCYSDDLTVDQWMNEYDMLRNAAY